MSDPIASLLQPEEEVLSTLNRDGTRKWLKPKISAGRFLTRRQWIGYGLIALFAAMPTLRMNGKPLMLLDIANRQFTFFGHTFLPTDTALLALLMLSLFVGIFLITALLGRVWCGYACPQTVYMELVYRPIERWIDGTLGKGGRPSRERSAMRTIALYAIYFVISLVLAHIFLAYFVSLEELFKWMQRSPLDHPQSFIIVLVTTGLTMFNFTYFREQTCLVACPYGRVQSVLLDRDSLIVSYDQKRGEPRGRLRTNDVSLPVMAARGDCIDCGLCVVTCPTGIDIRKGLQMECVACAQCIDACDTVMEKIGKPRGLIRYSSQRLLSGEPRRIVRPRVVLYSIAILAALAALSTLLLTKGTADVTLLRGKGLPFTKLPSGEISNPLQIKVINRTAETASYTLSVSGSGSPRIIAEENPLKVEPWKYRTEPILIAVASDAFVNGKAHVDVTVSDGRGFERKLGYELLGGWGTQSPAFQPTTAAQEKE
ncbi:MAG: cytochrome c oxidase accessory protein CcoG [Phycisphaerae bacterium]